MLFPVHSWSFLCERGGGEGRSSLFFKAQIYTIFSRGKGSLLPDVLCIVSRASRAFSRYFVSLAVAAACASKKYSTLYP